MGTSDNWLASKFRVEAARAADSARFFRDLIQRELPRRREEFEQLKARVLGSAEFEQQDCLGPHPPPCPLPPREGESKRNTAAQRVPWDPSNPERWHRRLVDAELAKPRVGAMYLAIRRALWDWPEFATLRPGARAILEVVLELARDEAFPWYVSVPAHEVRRLARLSEGSFARRVRELMCFAVVRAGKIDDSFGRELNVVRPEEFRGRNETPLTSPRRVASGDPALSQREREAEKNPHPNPPPCAALSEEGDGLDCSCDRQAMAVAPAERTSVAQFVVLYRRGIPWNAKRAAWWLNYDLLLGTGRVLPCFAVSPGNLQVTYQARNKAMGASPGVVSEGALDALRAVLAKRGPQPGAGFRAALWCGAVP